MAFLVSALLNRQEKTEEDNQPAGRAEDDEEDDNGGMRVGQSPPVKATAEMERDLFLLPFFTHQQRQTAPKFAPFFPSPIFDGVGLIGRLLSNCPPYSPIWPSNNKSSPLAAGALLPPFILPSPPPLQFDDCRGEEENDVQQGNDNGPLLDFPKGANAALESRSNLKKAGHPYQSRAQPSCQKKPRTSFTKIQVSLLECRFAEQKYLASTERASLASQLNMADGQVKTWFQNRRTKWRRQEAEERSAKGSRKMGDAGGSDSPLHQQQPTTTTTTVWTTDCF